MTPALQVPSATAAPGWRILRRLWLAPFAVGLRVAPGRTLGLIGALVVAAVAPAGMALVTGLIVGVAIPQGKAATTIVSVVALLTLAFLVGQLAAHLVAALADVYGGVLDREISSRVMAAQANASTGAPAALQRLIDLMNETLPVRQLVIGSVQQLLRWWQAVLGGLLIIWYVPAAGLVAVAACVFCAAQMEKGYDQAQSRAYSMAEASRRPRYLSHLGFDLSAAREVKTFRAADWLIERYDAAAEAAHGDDRVRTGLTVLLSYAAVLATAIALLVVLAEHAIHGELGAGAVAVCISALTGLSGIFAVNMNVVYAAKAGQFFEQVKDAGVLRTPGPAIADEVNTVGEGRTVTPPAPGSVIRFENVSYAYPGGQQVFRDLSFEVRLGTRLAIVGPNGAGKSTLIRLLAGLVPPDSGTIVCDGHAIGRSEAERSRWRAAFAFVGQHFIRYPATLAQNVLLTACPEPISATALALLSELDPALLEESAPLLAKGVRSGRGLSGGQWQRAATARAVHALEQESCRVLLLDEPTASLDAQAEARFFAEADGLVGLDCTTVMVSHRLAGVREADEILVLDSGRIIERGDHTSLMRQDRAYAEMFTVQARRFHD